MSRIRNLNQTAVARNKPLNSPTALAFLVFYHTVRNVIRFINCVTCMIASPLVESDDPH